MYGFLLDDAREEMGDSMMGVLNATIALALGLSPMDSGCMVVLNAADAAGALRLSPADSGAGDAADDVSERRHR